MSSLIKEYQRQEKLSFIKKQAKQVQKQVERLDKQIKHLDNFVDLDSSSIMYPLSEALATNRELSEVLSVKPTEDGLKNAFELKFLLEAQVASLSHNVDYVLSQGIEFLRLPEEPNEEESSEPNA